MTNSSEEFHRMLGNNYVSAIQSSAPPATMRYQPKPTNVCVCTNRSNHFTAMNETIADTTVASMSIIHFSCPPEEWRSALNISNPPAASIVGMLTRKENSVAA